MLMQFARLKSSQPLEGLRSPVIDRPTVAHHYQCALVRESQVGQKEKEWTDKLSSPRTETRGLLPCVAAALYRTLLIAFLPCGRLIARSMYCTSSSKRKPVTTVRA